MKNQITEKQFNEALKVVQGYRQQVNNKIKQTLSVSYKTRLSKKKDVKLGRLSPLQLRQRGYIDRRIYNNLRKYVGMYLQMTHLNRPIARLAEDINKNAYLQIHGCGIDTYNKIMYIAKN